MVAKPVTVGVVGVIVLASALVLNYFVLPDEEAETATPAVASPAARTTPPSRSNDVGSGAAGSSAGGSGAAVASAPAATATVPDRERPLAPSFDVVRVDPDGNAVIAGRGMPNSEIVILDDEEELGRVTADDRGEWVFIPPDRLTPGERVLSLRGPGLGPAGSESVDAVVLVIPEKGKDIAGRPSSQPGMPLAVVVPRDQGAGGATARVLQAPAAGPLAAGPLAAGPQAAGQLAAGPGVPAVAAGPEASSAAGSATGDPAASGATSTETGGTAATATAADASVAGTTRAAGTPSAGTQTAGTPSAGTQTAGTPSAGTQTAGTPSAGTQTAGTPSAGTQTAGVPSARTREPASSAVAVPGPADPAAAPSAAPSAAALVPGMSSYPEAAATSPRAGEAGSPGVAVDVIDYDDKGDVGFSGRADPGARVEVFIDDRKVGDTDVDREGRWTMRPEEPVTPGAHDLRVDNVTAAGTIEARVAFPFVRANPLTELPGNRLVVIQPGNNLWRIATRVYGDGVRFVEIFDANRDQILNPDLIYPGQVFGLPRAN